jgi:hypothetical protein
VVAPDNKEGFEGKALFHSSNLSFYLQVKISFPAKPMIDAIASTIIYSLSDAFLSSNKMSNIHIIFYNFGDHRNTFEITSDLHEFLREIHAGIDVEEGLYNKRCANACQLVNRDNEIDSFKVFVKDFLNKNYNNPNKTFHYLAKEDLECWMLPSFLPFAHVCQAIANETEIVEL